MVYRLEIYPVGNSFQFALYNIRGFPASAQDHYFISILNIGKFDGYKERVIDMMDGLVIAKIDTRWQRPELPVNIETG